MWGQIIPAVIGAGTAIYGAQQQRAAANQVAGATRDAANQSNEATLRALAYSAPYREGGLQDYNALRQQVGSSFQASPGYQFAREEGIRAIDQAASARGMLGSGARLRELTRYGTGVANQEYGNWLSRLQNLASVGQTASGQAASLAQQSGQQQANLTLAGGQAQAQGTVGQANALLGGVNQGIGLWSLMNPQGGSRNATSGFSQGGGLAGIY
jgi:hypothetical protein